LLRSGNRAKAGAAPRAATAARKPRKTTPHSSDLADRRQVAHFYAGIEIDTSCTPMPISEEEFIAVEGGTSGRANGELARMADNAISPAASFVD